MNEIKTIRIWVGNDFVEFELEKTADMSEDEFYEKAVDYIYSNLTVEVI